MQYFAIEEIGNGERRPEREIRAAEDAEVEQHFRDTVRYVNGQYVVKYFVRKNVERIDSNFRMAASRLKATLKMLWRIPN